MIAFRSEIRWPARLAAIVWAIPAIAAATPVEIPLVNPGFETGANPTATGWLRVDGTAPNSSPSSYAEPIPHLASRTMQLKSDGGNHVQQALTQDAAGQAIDAASFPSWSVGFRYGYRRDAVTQGDHIIRVSLWNTTADGELAGQDLLITDPGSSGTNTLEAAEIVLEYDHTDPALAGAGVALRFTSASADLGGDAWRRTAVLDDVTISVSGDVPDPRLIAPTSLHVTSAGEAVDFTLPVANGGTTEPLVISSAVLGGPDAARFSVAAFPTAILPGESGNVHLTFQPDGLANTFSASLTLATNDPRGLPHLVEITAAVDDPDITYNQWAAGFGLDPETDGAPRADPDGDGLPNEEEFRLDTDPVDPSDPDGRPWLPRPEKAAMMVFSAHPDDEGIFFGGTLPYYAQVRRVPIVLVAVTSGDYVLDPPVREQEMRNAAWRYGLRTQPVFTRFPDAPFSSLDENFDVWGGGLGAAAGRLATAMEFAKWLRRYRPDVVLTHDFNGEYGHNNHKATAIATVDAVDLAADPGLAIEDLPPWQVKKLYVNQYEGNPLFHDHWEETTIDTSGDGTPDSTPREVANRGLAEHKTQNNGNFKVVSVFQPGANAGFNWDAYPSEHWGLYRSTVGPDDLAPDFIIMGRNYQGWARGGFLQNLTTFPDQDGDGLPDAWELHWFGGVTAADPHDDAANDGMINLDKFILGLAPTRFDRVPQSAAADGFHFHLPAAAGPGYDGLRRHYEVLHSGNLEAWNVIASGTAEGTPAMVPWPAGGRGFSRLRVWLE